MLSVRLEEVCELNLANELRVALSVKCESMPDSAFSGIVSPSHFNAVVVGELLTSLSLRRLLRQPKSSPI